MTDELTPVERAEATRLATEYWISGNAWADAIKEIREKSVELDSPETLSRDMRQTLGDLVPHQPYTPGQRVAQLGMILRVQSGSELSGIALPGPSDHDEIGVCLEPPEYTMGLKQFEQYLYRSAGGSGEPSRPGDLDLTVYSAKKFLRQAARGNPNYLATLFAPDASVLYSNQAGEDLRSLAPYIVSRRVAAPFLGYLDSQRKALLGERAGAGGERGRKLIAEHGYHVKFAAHMVRLGLQGSELLSTGKLTLPIANPCREWLIDVRKGKHSLKDVLEYTEVLENEIKALRFRSDLPIRDEPDYDVLNDWLINAHLRHYSW